MSRLSFLDLAFFITESAESPKHVAGLSLFKKPARAGANWLPKLYQGLQGIDQVSRPFDQVVDLKNLTGPRWRTAEHFDLLDHLFFHQPEQELSETELYAMISKLHEPLMDRSRPMWEYHLIDNIAGGHFAVYSKIHHAYADGVTMSRWSIGSLASKASDK
jgi:hypothetical protein